MVDVDMDSLEQEVFSDSNSSGEDGPLEEEEEEGASDSESDGEEETGQEGRSGWADSIARILKSNKPKHKKELILSRARKDYEVRKAVREPKPKDNLEIVAGPSADEEGEDKKVMVKEEEDKDNVLSLKAQRKLELKQRKLELAWENLARMSAEKTDPEMERDLTRVATKGVVQLFNAIIAQQKTVKSKLKNVRKSEFKKDKVLHQSKDIFEDALTKSKKTRSRKDTEEDDVEIKQEEFSSDEEAGPGPSSRKRHTDSDSGKTKKPKWTALKDDFMLDAKLQDWDKSESEGEKSDESEDDDDSD